MTVPTTPPEAPPPLPPVPREGLRRARSRRWWLAVPVAVVALVAGVVAVVVPFAAHDAPELVEDDRVLTVAADPCARVQEAGATLAAATTPEDRAAAALDVTEGARALAAAVGALPADVLDADRPARSWAEDWSALADGLEAWAASTAAGEDAPFELPLTDDGWSVVTRMDLAASPACAVPASVVSLDATPPRTPPAG
ncbi:hypothetical protein [Cellulosimicrobium sp. TH-20]|uniref:hypothetical protein n=1 Tax=Cellulosimicrobium sp. TH-20 TaxID=1980001 RepID=UPI001643CD4B|nr:hypothetical protein [Cellulosimicrobium sp. TH-20]